MSTENDFIDKNMSTKNDYCDDFIEFNNEYHNHEMSSNEYHNQGMSSSNFDEKTLINNEKDIEFSFSKLILEDDEDFKNRQKTKNKKQKDDNRICISDFIIKETKETRKSKKLTTRDFSRN